MPATDKFFYELKTMHLVFAASAIALFATTIWMLADDHIEEWHGYQKIQFRIDAEKIKRAQAVINTREHKNAVDQLKKDFEAADKSSKGKDSEASQISAEVEKLTRSVVVTTKEAKDRRQYRDVARADYDLGVRDNVAADSLASLKGKFDQQQSRVDEIERDLEEKETALGEAKSRLGEATKARDSIQASLKEQQAEMDRLHKSLASIDPGQTSWFSGAKRSLMEWPIIDGFNSHLRIHQDWLPDLPIKLGMAQTARFDRCRTCHVSIDAVEAGNVPAFPFGHPEGDKIAD